MKRTLSLAALATFAALLASCRTPEPVVINHYHNTTTTRTTKSASVDRSNTPEGFSAVTPPASYSR
jgi:hypothetical protein